MNMQQIPNILTKILNTKAQEVAKNRQRQPLAKLYNQLQHQPRGFRASIKAKLQQNKAAVIAEIKKASPSKGVLRQNFDPVAIAAAYQKSGACCLSVLTDTDYFQGSNDYLKAVASSCQLPVLRKDFIIDEYQIVEARAIGADAVLLIAKALSDGALQQLYQLAKSLELDVLLEVHNSTEMERALNLDADLIGINNRNLETFEVDLTTSIELKKLVDNDAILVTESGINERQQVEKMRDNQIDAFLVGEAFMRQTDPGAALIELFGKK